MGGVGHGASNIAALLVVGGKGGVTRTFLICISKPILLHIEWMGDFFIDTGQQGSKFKFEFGSACATRRKFLGALPKF